MHPLPIIELRHLSKTFGDLHAVDDLNLDVFEGDIFGFLGPNGAGKSTTIRMMLSLVKPSEGLISIFGKELNQNRHEILQRIGCIIEDPDFYLYLSGEKNLDLFARLSGKSPETKKIHELMELVGLKGREQDKVKTYSHGMKQRLGIAQTLIHDPDLIILDEPTTGLDPQGIIDVRNLILHLKNDLRKTIFLSSHLLHEVEQIATRMAIINKGKAVVQGNVSELLSTHDLNVSVEVDNGERMNSLISSSAWQHKLIKKSGGHFEFRISKEEIPVLNQFLNGAGLAIYGTSYRRNLEDYFLKLTQDAS
ncbi:MAG: ABC transporter ATP-binding protein [Chitinophagales bacterium]|nr:ABC transporter ATP-binding protein [Bacteroidota bacterium]MBX7142029.1 ABC transporter ATP-binding protein [Chitinophagales bacterium]